MSANPEFLDQLDADVPEVSDAGDIERTADKPSDSGEVSGTGQSGQDSKESGGDATKDKVDPKQDDKVEKVVPLKALQEERETVKELKNQIRELQAQPKLSEEDKALLASLKEQKKAAEAPKPVDFMEDPKGYIDTSVATVKTALEKLSKTAEETTTTLTQQQQHQQLISAIVTHETAFVKDNPDYYQALEHIRGVRRQQLQLMAPQATEAQIAAALNQEEMQTAAQLLSRGQNPIDFAYKLAKTYGYAKKEAPPPPKQQETDKSAARTMGSGGSEGEPEDDSDDPNSEFKAVKALFGKRR